MASRIIHLAIAQQYVKKHKNEIKNLEDFSKGSLAPDEVEDKSLTHYGNSSSEVHLLDFLKENRLDSDYQKGYFLHLYTDYLFYNQYLTTYSTDIYHDYDILDSQLIEYYQLSIPSSLQSNINVITDNNYTFLTFDFCTKIIHEISEYQIQEVEKQVLNHNPFGNTLRPLHQIPPKLNVI